jgi:hypothetical protein
VKQKRQPRPLVLSKRNGPSTNETATFFEEFSFHEGRKLASGPVANLDTAKTRFLPLTILVWLQWFWLPSMVVGGIVRDRPPGADRRNDNDRLHA